MDNPQKRPAVEWLAGFVDGEGSFILQVSKERRWKNGTYGIRLRPRITIPNMHKPTMDFIAGLLEEWSIGNQFTVVSRKAQNPKHSQGYVISVNGHKRSLKLLKLLLPYLVTRWEQAKLLEEFIEWRLTLPKDAWTGGHAEKAKEYIDRLRTLNGNKKPSGILRDFTPNIDSKSTMIKSSLAAKAQE